MASCQPNEWRFTPALPTFELQLKAGLEAVSLPPIINLNTGNYRARLKVRLVDLESVS